MTEVSISRSLLRLARAGVNVVKRQPAMSQPALSIAAQQALRCPVCKSRIEYVDEHYRCTNSRCGRAFPRANGIPVLINEESSVFSLADLIHQRSTTYNPGLRRKVIEMVDRLLPDFTVNLASERNYDEFAKLLLSSARTPVVLVIGGSILGKGMRALSAYPAIELVESDVTFGARTAVICDAHDLPFGPDSFDGVIAQAVLEHVVDPYRAVDEIHRVLKVGGFVYAEVPFMQQVHGGAYDFTRFTHLGLRRLFRTFEEVASGVANGPGTALAWSLTYFLLSFTDAKLPRALIHRFSRLVVSPVKYFDYCFDGKAGALDAASGFYFLGQKGSQVLPDQELVKLYKGWLQ